MKTILSSSALTVFALILTGPSAHASDLSQLFRALEFTQQTAAPAASPTPAAAPAPSRAAAAPRLLLGAWLSDTNGTLQVTGTVADSPASRTLQPGDVLRQITIPEGRVCSLKTLNQFEHAKRQIGPQRTSLLEVYRPGVGTMSMEVTFESEGGLAGIVMTAPAAAGNAPAGLASR